MIGIGTIKCDTRPIDNAGDKDMTGTPNVLGIMADQLQHDDLSYYGPSHMSAYTGRNVRSHGSTRNSIPLYEGGPTSEFRMRVSNCGCDALERDDGMTCDSLKPIGKPAAT